MTNLYGVVLFGFNVPSTYELTEFAQWYETDFRYKEAKIK